MNIRILLAAASLALLCAIPAVAQTHPPVVLQPPVKPGMKGDAATGETPAQFAARTAWWREAKFGMFIHWGVYAVPAEGEWHMNNAKMQVSDYEKFAAQFNPVKFDAKKWVKTAKDAGMKYIVITTKHHDGFSMWDTKLSDYNIVKATPFGRDPLKELAAECKKQGIKLGFYHSVMDWHEPNYLPRRAWEVKTRPAAGANLDTYITHMEGQLRELLTNYGPIGVIWFDGGWEHNAKEERATEVVKLIRSLQPNILINNRINLPEDFDTPEQNIPANALPQGRLWETCMTLNDNWGFAKNDTHWKPTDDLIRKLCDIASKGGNFLLNVGPTAAGEIPSESTERLAQVGKWMKANGKSIYGTTQSPWRKLPFDGRCTVSGDKLYLQVFAWPDDGLTLTGLKTPIKQARVLDGGEKLTVKTDSDGGLSIAHPETLDPNATVIELQLSGPAIVDDVPFAVRPGKDGVFTLSASDANLEGGTAQVETKNGIPSIGFWTDLKDTVAWQVDVPAMPPPGGYSVTLEYACAPESAGSQFQIHADGTTDSVNGTVAPTGAWDTFGSKTLPGVIHLEAGRRTLRLRPTTMPHGAVMNLRRVVLTPAPYDFRRL